MNEELEIIQKIRQTPQKYIGEPNLSKLCTFLDGFSTCEHMHDPDYISPLLYLNNYAAMKFDDTDNNICTILKNHASSEESAFYSFFQLVDEYLSMPSFKKCELYFIAHSNLFPTLYEKSLFLNENYKTNVDYIYFQTFVKKYFGYKNEHDDWYMLISNTSETEQEKSDIFYYLLDLSLSESQK